MSKAVVRHPAPAWKKVAVVNGEFKTVSNEDYKGKYLVVFFYPLDFTFVCPTEIIAFSEKANEFRAIGCEVVAVSCDSEFTHLAWINTPRKQGGLGEMQIPVVADVTKSMTKDFGALIEEDGVPLRATFIIDDKGILRHASYNDLPVGRSVEEYIRLVAAFQHSDKFGVVCPAGWKGKDSKTMKADPKGSKEYFEAAN